MNVKIVATWLHYCKNSKGKNYKEEVTVYNIPYM